MEQQCVFAVDRVQQPAAAGVLLLLMLLMIPTMEQQRAGGEVLSPGCSLLPHDSTTGTCCGWVFLRTHPMSSPIYSLMLRSMVCACMRVGLRVRNRGKVSEVTRFPQWARGRASTGAALRRKSVSPAKIGEKGDAE